MRVNAGHVQPSHRGARARPADPSVGGPGREPPAGRGPAGRGRSDAVRRAVSAAAGAKSGGHRSVISSAGTSPSWRTCPPGSTTRKSRSMTEAQADQLLALGPVAVVAGLAHRRAAPRPAPRRAGRAGLGGHQRRRAAGQERAPGDRGRPSDRDLEDRVEPGGRWRCPPRSSRPWPPGSGSSRSSGCGSGRTGMISAWCSPPVTASRSTARRCTAGSAPPPRPPGSGRGSRASAGTPSSAP